MTSHELREYLSVLKVTNHELAQLMGVNERTVQRWLSDQTEIPGGIARALEAWFYLDRVGLPWRPDGVQLVRPAFGQVTVALRIDANGSLEDVIRAVLSRGGPTTPWIVDIGRRRATLGHAWIKFKILQYGKFVPQSYGRSDIEPDMLRDRALIEDGYARIAISLREIEALRLQDNWKEVAI